MAHTVYENAVLENKIEDMLITNIDANAYLTADYSLTEDAGMTKKVHVYSATGDVEELAMGEGNTSAIEVSFVEKEYKVKTYQEHFPYYDEQEMTDPMIVDTGMAKLSANMTNTLTTKAIEAMGEATLTHAITGWDFDNVVDAIALYPYENEDGLFMLINPAQKASLRKSLADELKYVEGFARTGYIGSVCNVPVITSKAVPAGIAFLGTKEAVKCFVKKGVEIEQERDADTRKNDIYARKVMLVALADATRMIKLGASQATALVITTPDVADEAVAGTCAVGAKVSVYVNGELAGTATATAGTYSVACDALASGDEIKVVAKLDGYLDAVEEATVA